MIPNNITITLSDGRVVHYAPTRVEVPAIDLTPDLLGRPFQFHEHYFQLWTESDSFSSKSSSRNRNVNPNKLLFIRRIHEFSVELQVSHRSGMPFKVGDMVRIPKPNGKKTRYRITHVRDCTTQSVTEYLAVFHPRTKPIKR